MDNIESVLVLKKLVFDNISFNRIDFKSDKDITFNFEIQYGKNKSVENENSDAYRVTLKSTGCKEGEYTISISISGFFSFKIDEEIPEEVKEALISKNAVTILMPYLRSQISLLTAQPGVDSVVLPPLNINKLLEEQ
ncbi:Preprotein translocase subunit SecB [Anaerosporobacter mobilis DSM 15930]|uniref:Preprotein translocase subunit SecB n=1 Tax=Anaerosporobacter mobilis DSM 15930 TaxID=1120996 RepID=A0A1M7LGB1_9FIRM|nr:protein-export chaperone SecB [Anaerosporobacter mobilis]SHM76980.1 Preprotein translocase subunit SecB [Anaerosporobacter mobilis DSM 15930]